MSTDHPPNQSRVPSRPERERIDLTPDQVQAIRTMSEHQVREYLQDPGLSKATISRLRHGQRYYVRGYHTPETHPNPALAETHSAEIADAAARGVRNAMRVLMRQAGCEEDEAFLPASVVTDIAERVNACLEDLAGHPDFSRPGWRNQVAYHRAYRFLENARNSPSSADDTGV